MLRFPASSPVPSWVDTASRPLVSLTYTADELSVVCPSASVPVGLRVANGWCAFRVEGTLEFSLVGVLAAILAPLAEAGISIFSLSTFDTDYILVRADRADDAAAVLRRHFTLVG